MNSGKMPFDLQQTNDDSLNEDFEQTPPAPPEEAANVPTPEEKPAEKKKRRFGKKQSEDAEKNEDENAEKEADEEKDGEEKKEKKKKDKPKDAKGAAKRLIGYIAEHKRSLIIVGLSVVIATVLGVLGSLLMRPVYATLEGVVVKGDLDGQAAMAKILKYVGIMGVIYVISTALALIQARVMLNVSVKTVKNLRRDLFNHLQGLPIGYFDQHKTGEIMSRFTSDANRVSELVSDSFPTIISSVITAVMSVTIMLVFSWKITLTLTVSVGLMVLIVVFITNKCAPLFKKQQKAIGECNGYIEEYVRGLKAVKLFCFEDRSKKRFAELNEEYRRTGVRANIIGGFMGPLVSMISRMNYALSVSLGALMVVKGKMTVPNLIVFLQYAASYGSPTVSIASCYSSLISALAGAERIFEVLDTPFEEDGGNVTLAKVVEGIMGFEEDEEHGKPAWKIPEEDGTARYVPVRCEIDIHDVSFAYVEDKPVLHHVNAHANAGEKLAFVGSTGAGKTTITNLINRFYEVKDGAITIDGIDIKDIRKKDLRHSMAFVLQDSRLFAGTIAENIRYGKLDATDEEVIAAAKLANAHSFIEKLPDGYETSLRSDGVNISQGQGQLLNIARAAIADRPLLVLDEATSSVDTRTERLIEKGMDQIMEGKTVLVIAHRLSTVRNSEEILVLENGEVIEHGDHDALIALNGKYYELYTGMFEMT